MPIRASGALRRSRQAASEPPGPCRVCGPRNGFADVDGLDRAGVVQHLFVMAVALSVGALALGIAADRLRQVAVSDPKPCWEELRPCFIAVQVALILRLPLAIVSAVERRGGDRRCDRAELR